MSETTTAASFTVDRSIFKGMTGTLGALSEKVAMEISPEGLRCTLKDGGSVAVADLDIPREALMACRVEETTGAPVRVAFDRRRYELFLNATGESETVDVEVHAFRDADGKLNYRTSLRAAGVEVPIWKEDLMTEEVKGLSLEWPVSVEVDAGEMRRALDLAGEFSFRVVLRVEGGKLTVHSYHDYAENTGGYSKSEGARMTLQRTLLKGDVDAASVFLLNPLQKVIAAIPSEMCTLMLGTELPVGIHYELGKNARVIFIQRPHLDEP